MRLVTEVFRPILRQNSPSSVTNRISNTKCNTGFKYCPTFRCSFRSQQFQEPSRSYNTKRYFGNPAKISHKNKWLEKRKEAQNKKSKYGPFSRDIVLLSGPDYKDIPRQGSKVFLQQIWISQWVGWHWRRNWNTSSISGNTAWWCWHWNCRRRDCDRRRRDWCTYQLQVL